MALLSQICTNTPPQSARLWYDADRTVDLNLTLRNCLLQGSGLVASDLRVTKGVIDGDMKGILVHWEVLYCRPMPAGC